jgi:hypothetical protein
MKPAAMAAHYLRGAAFRSETFEDGVPFMELVAR